MKIIKSMSTLGLVLLVLTSTAAASAEGGPWWAVAEGVAHGRNDGIYSAYGAAWDYPSEQEAIEAAMKTCKKHGNCWYHRTGRNSCFVIDYSVARYSTDPSDTRRETGYRTEVGLFSRAEAEARAELIAQNKFADESVSIELVECAGVD